MIAIAAAVVLLVILLILWCDAVFEEEGDDYDGY